MGTEEMKKCPYCAEMIKKEAVKCRYCSSVLEKKGFDFNYFRTQGYWHRVNEGKKIAGVCTGLARQFDNPVLILPLRVFFVVTTVIYGFGLILYVVLWILMPAPVDTPVYQQDAPDPGAPPPPPHQAPYRPPAVGHYPGQEHRSRPAAPPARDIPASGQDKAPGAETPEKSEAGAKEDGTLELGKSESAEDTSSPPETADKEKKTE